MDTVNHANISDGQMELVLESDEEEASLLEEMEQQETVSSAGMVPESKIKQAFGEAQQRKNNRFLKVNKSLQTYVNEDALGIAGNRHCKQSFQQCGLQRVYAKNPIKEEVPGTELEDKLGGAQILQMNISEYELIAAKLAVALQPQMETVVFPGSSFPPHFLSLDGVSKGFSLTGQDTFHHDIMGSPSTVTNGKKTIQKVKKMSDMRNSGLNHFNTPIDKDILLRRKRQKQKRNVHPEHIYQQGQVAQVSHAEQDTTDVIVKNVQNFPRSLPTAENSKSHEVIFYCQFCSVKYPLKEENIPVIIKHLNPPQRYNHVFKMPDQLSSYKENIKLSVVIAKNKSKAQVRLESCVECLSCKQQLTCNVENSEHITLHTHWCKNSDSDSKTVVCVFCNEIINRSCIRKHLHHRSRRCKKVDALTLQLMSSVCEDYASKHKPICIVCNEREWPYKGHRSEMEPVCESCHLNIISGNTTKLAHRDVTVCAICGHHCADKYVTYWASEMESLFIGESCIKKLKNPKPKLSEETASLKVAKLKSFIEVALSSVTVQESSESSCSLPRLTPNIFDKCERKCGSNNNSSHSLGYREKYKTDNLAQRGKIKPVARSFKILHSHTSLPFVNLVPSFAVDYSKEAEDKVNSKNTSPLANVSQVSLDIKQLKSQACKESCASGIYIFPLSEQIHCRDKKFENQRDTVLKSQEKLPCVPDGNSKNCAQATHDSKGGEVGNTLQIASLDDGNSECKMYAVPSPESNRNIMSTVSSSQSSVPETPVAEELYPHSVVSKVTTESEEPKYVIKCVSTSESKPAGVISNIIAKNHIIIKASSNMSYTDEVVKSPRLASIIKTRGIVCGEDCNEKKPLLQKRHKRKQSFLNDQASEVVILD